MPIDRGQEILELQEKVQALESENLQMKAEIKKLTTSRGPAVVNVNVNPKRLDPVKYLVNYATTALFPIVSGVFRIIYKLIYKLK